MKGKLIVIDGVDGAGKKTQTTLLCERLKHAGHKVMPITYPRYGQASAALVEMYLRGEFGVDEKTVNPYVASTFYALDRFAESAAVKEALAAGTIVVADRYVTANMAHQGGKIDDLTERTKYFDWVYDFEYNKCELSKPDLILLLYAPFETTHELLKNRGEAKDIHESSLSHLQRTSQAYLDLSRQFGDMIRLDCAEHDTMMAREKIHELIWEKVSPLLSL